MPRVYPKRGKNANYAENIIMRQAQDSTHLFESPVHNLQLLSGELCVPTKGVQTFRFVPNDLHLKVIQVMI